MTKWSSLSLGCVHSMQFIALHKHDTNIRIAIRKLFCILCLFVYLLCSVSIRSCLVLFQPFAYVQVFDLI